MNIRLSILRAILICMAMIAGTVRADMPITRYMHITHFEETVLNEYIPFGEADTSYGIIRSNDFLSFSGRTWFGMVITSKDSFLLGENVDPPSGRNIFNAPPYQFPSEYPQIKSMADVVISSRDGELMTRIEMSGWGGVSIFQYPIGEDPDNADLVRRVSHPWETIILVDGQVEVEGTVYGIITIYSTDDMWLVDNIRYEGADRITGDFDENWMDNMLGLVSERNIIIKDNIANGRGDGFNDDPDDHDRHSIVINGSLVALGGSFTFEHQNDEDDEYQGPEPDERGTIYLKGSIAQYRRGYVHRENHDGTGYSKNYRWDFRLDRTGPPGFGIGEQGIIEGYYDRLVLPTRWRGPRRYTMGRTTVNELVIYGGVEIELVGATPLIVNKSLEMLGAEKSPIDIRTFQTYSRSIMRVRGGPGSKTVLEHTQFNEGVLGDFMADTIVVDSCTFGSPVSFQGNIHLSGSRFSGKVDLVSWRNITVENCVFEDGLVVNGNPRNALLTNNTIVGGRLAGVELERFQSIRLINNIVAFNQTGIVNRDMGEPVLIYNDVFGNEEDYVDCEPGEGSFSEDPLFVDWEAGDYYLSVLSPCIDSGDPDSPMDSDNTRADLGAFPFNQTSAGNHPPVVVRQIADVRIQEDSEPHRTVIATLNTIFRDSDLDELLFGLNLEDIPSELNMTITSGSVLYIEPDDNFNLPDGIEIVVIANDPYRARAVESFNIVIDPVADPPGSFSLLTPRNGSEIDRRDYNVNFSWNHSEDPDGDEVTYTLFVHINHNDIDTTIVRENLNEPSFNVEHLDSTLMELGIVAEENIYTDVTWWVEASDGELVAESNRRWSLSVPVPVGVPGAGSNLPSDFNITRIYPNPFNNQTRIDYYLPRTAEVSLDVFSQLGEHRSTLFRGVRSAGTHSAILLADNLPSGLYFVRLEAAGEVRTQKVMLVR